MVAPNKLMHHVAKNAVNKFNSSQLNLLLVLVIIPSVISSSPGVSVEVDAIFELN